MICTLNLEEGELDRKNPIIFPHYNFPFSPLPTHTSTSTAPLKESKMTAKMKTNKTKVNSWLLSSQGQVLVS